MDADVLRRANEIAARMWVPQPRPRRRSRRRGPGRPVSLPYRGDCDEIDLDRTLVNLVEHPALRDEDVVVRERRRPRRSLVLLVDVSGSMRGERARTAAATVGAVYAEFAGSAGSGDAVAVVAFWSDAALVVPLGQPESLCTVLARVLSIPSRGLTNVGFPLTVAAQQLAQVSPAGARVLLLSDCVHNAGPDPRGPAARLPRLDVLLDTSGEHDLVAGQELAAAGRGRLARAASHHDVGLALSSIFSDD